MIRYIGKSDLRPSLFDREMQRVKKAIDAKIDSDFVNHLAAPAAGQGRTMTTENIKKTKNDYIFAAVEQLRIALDTKDMWSFAEVKDLIAANKALTERLEQETKAHSLTAAKLRTTYAHESELRSRMGQLYWPMSDWIKDESRGNEVKAVQLLLEKYKDLQQEFDTAMKTIGECWEALPEEYQPPQVEGISKESVQGQVAKLVADFKAQTDDIKTAEYIVQALEELVVSTVDALQKENAELKNEVKAVSGRDEERLARILELRNANAELSLKNLDLQREKEERAPKPKYDHGAWLTGGIRYRVVALASPCAPNNRYSVGVSFFATGNEGKLHVSVYGGWHEGRTVYNLDGGWFGVVERA